MNKVKLPNINMVEVRQCLEFDELIIVVYEVNEINPDIFYNNIKAFNTDSGSLFWQLEYFEDERESSKDGQFKSLGPYTYVAKENDFLIAFKAHGWKVVVDPTTGCIMKDIDLNFNGRAW